MVELIVVMAIIVVLVAAVGPAVSSIKGAGDATKAAYDVVGALENARAYAKANKTFVWVGMFEENGASSSSNPAVAGTGRVVLSTVASTDGTVLYNLDSPQPLSASRLMQVGKLVKLDNMHLASFVDGAGTSATFSGRPPLADADAHIGDGHPAAAATSFTYPLAAASPQYTFVTAIEFSPRGEARLNNATSGYKPLIEIGLRPTRGSAVQPANNPAAVQISGIVGGIVMYRP